jgi:hypothetical protein
MIAMNFTLIFMWFYTYIFVILSLSVLDPAQPDSIKIFLQIIKFLSVRFYCFRTNITPQYSNTLKTVYVNYKLIFENSMSVGMQYVVKGKY